MMEHWSQKSLTVMMKKNRCMIQEERRLGVHHPCQMMGIPSTCGTISFNQDV